MDKVDSEYRVTFAELQRVPSTGTLESLPNLHPQTVFIQEPDVYELIFRSQLPAAKKFRRSSSIHMKDRNLHNPNDVRNCQKAQLQQTRCVTI